MGSRTELQWRGIVGVAHHHLQRNRSHSHKGPRRCHGWEPIDTAYIKCWVEVHGYLGKGEAMSLFSIVT